MGGGILMPGKGLVGEWPASDEACWILSDPYEVFRGNDGSLWSRHTINSGDGETATFTHPIFGVFFNPLKDPKPLIAIKGISDLEPKNIIEYGEAR
jgi:hypothetical protein